MLLEIIYSALFLLVLLNPFLVVVYLIDAIKKLSFSEFKNVLLRAGFISFGVFSLFAILGDVIFENLIQAEFASFQIFGGIVFLLIGLQFIFKGGSAIEDLRGESKHIAGAIAMPILIGPGTISYSVVIGQQLEKLMAVAAIFTTVFFSLSIIILLKYAHDKIHHKKERLVQRYFEVAGRITALIAGTIAIDMIMQGLGYWLDKI